MNRKTNKSSVSAFILAAVSIFSLTAGHPLWADDVCGDGYVTGAEVCDDFNTDDGDGCAGDCSATEEGWFCSEFDPGPPPFFTFCVPICGDGFVVPLYEECDDNMTNGDGCDDDPFNGGNCTATGCGNAVVTDGEVCDDGSPVDGDGCAADCSAVEEGWACDNSFGFSVCSPVCGDGFLVEGLEECEDGNGVNGDGCDDDVTALTPGNCTFTACGNLVESSGEQCDDGKQCSDGTPCSDDSFCLFVGDEICKTRDADFNFDFCDSNCTSPGCGNGIVNNVDNEFFTLIEDCDDGNLANGDGCDSNCTVTACGNGILTAGEVCDDGNTVNDDGCSADCKPECGDGVRGVNEECDDGNNASGDGCSGVCTVEGEVDVCGNGLLEAGEECDDGNIVGGDGCEANCTDQSFESANPTLTFAGFFVGDEVVVNSPDPRGGSSAALVLPSNCSCTWSIAPLALGHFASATDCQTRLTLDREGDGTLSVQADCGADGSSAFLQAIVVQPKPVEDSGGCSLIPAAR